MFPVLNQCNRQRLQRPDPTIITYIVTIFTEQLLLEMSENISTDLDRQLSDAQESQKNISGHSSADIGNY